MVKRTICEFQKVAVSSEFGDLGESVRLCQHCVCILVPSPNNVGRLIPLPGPQPSGLQNGHGDTGCGYEEQGRQMRKNNAMYSWVKHFQLMHLHTSYLIWLIY